MIKRYKNNPIITPDMITPSISEFKIVSVINAAVTTFNNKILLLLRIAESLNGIDFNISNTPIITPANIYEEYGIEDPRITKFSISFLILEFHDRE